MKLEYRYEVSVLYTYKNNTCDFHRAVIIAETPEAAERLVLDEPLPDCITGVKLCGTVNLDVLDYSHSPSP